MQVRKRGSVAEDGRSDVQQSCVEVISVLVRENEVFEPVERASVLDQVRGEIGAEVDRVSGFTVRLVIEIEMNGAARTNVTASVPPCLVADATAAERTRDGFTSGRA